MKIENNFNASSKYRTPDDVTEGEVFRLVGETELFISTDSGYYSLVDGSSIYLDNEPVEIVVGHFVVDKII